MNQVMLIVTFVFGAISGGLYYSLQNRHRRDEEKGVARRQARMCLRIALNNAIRDITTSLAYANRSVGYLQTYEGWLLTGFLQVHRKDFSEAAGAFFEARHHAGYGVNSSGEFFPDGVALSFEREVVSYAHDLNWEFAWIRAMDALYLCQSCRIPSNALGCKNLEYRLRLIRLIAAINEVQRNKDLGRYIPEDADTILQTGTAGLADEEWRLEAERICMCALQIESVDVCRESINNAWIRLSEKQQAIEAELLAEEVNYMELLLDRADTALRTD